MDRPPLSRRTVLAALAAAACAPQDALADRAPWARAERIARSARPPRFTTRVWSIVEAGASADDIEATTRAFAQAIQSCAQAGGGRVLVPAGRWLTGAIRLRSRVELHLAEGATVVFSTDPAHYPLVATRWEGFGDEGGDTAYAAEVDGQQVLVYGSASPQELSGYVARLTDVPVEGADGADQDRQPGG